MNVEALGKGFGVQGSGDEGHSQSNDSQDSVRVAESEAVRRPDAEILPDHENLFGRRCESDANRSDDGEASWYLGDGEEVEDGCEIGDEVVPGGALWLRRLVGEAVAAAVGRDALEAGGGEGEHLVPPRVPDLGKSMEEKHGALLPCSEKGSVGGRRVEEWEVGALTASGVGYVEGDAIDVEERVLDLVHPPSPGCWELAKLTTRIREEDESRKYYLRVRVRDRNTSVQSLIYSFLIL